ncbi:hypothetical protein ACP4OV_009291 [Aristida adscensionis]
MSMPESLDPPPRPSKRPRHGEAPAVPPQLPEDVVLEQILTRVPAAATVRLRAVCRAWRAALTSDHFVRAYRAIRAAAGHPPEIAFFAPAAACPTSTTFYSYKLTQQNGSSSAAAAARELVTVENLDANDVLLCGTRPCHGLTLLFQRSACAYHVCNLATGEHVALPPCARAVREVPCSLYLFSSTGIGFDAAAGEHKVVRLYEDWDLQQRCEVYGLRSGGWRRCAGQPPPHAARGLDGSPPVFLDGRFYWHVNSRRNFAGQEALFFATPEPILSLAVDTEQFEWVRPPEQRRAQSVTSLAELDGSLCAVVESGLNYELWTRATAAGSPAPAWSLRCSTSLPETRWDAMGRRVRVLPLGSPAGGKILLATSRHRVFAYDPRSNAAERVFDMGNFVDAPEEPAERPNEHGLLLNIAVHEEGVTGVGHRRTAAGDDGGRVKMKLGGGTVAMRERPAGERREKFGVAFPQFIQFVLREGGVHKRLGTFFRNSRT